MCCCWKLLGFAPASIAIINPKHMLDAIFHDRSCGYAVLTRCSYSFSRLLPLHFSGKSEYIHKNDWSVRGNTVPNHVFHNKFIIHFGKSGLIPGSGIHKNPIHMAHITGKIQISYPRCKAKNNCNKAGAALGHTLMCMCINSYFKNDSGFCLPSKNI